MFHARHGCTPGNLLRTEEARFIAVVDMAKAVVLAVTVVVGMIGVTALRGMMEILQTLDYDAGLE